jgi:RND superfamily putative drug exporter
VAGQARLLGRANWWAPGPLRRFSARYGIRETDAAPPATPEPVLAPTGS